MLIDLLYWLLCEGEGGIGLIGDTCLERVLRDWFG